MQLQKPIIEVYIINMQKLVILMSKSYICNYLILTNENRRTTVYFLVYILPD